MALFDTVVMSAALSAQPVRHWRTLQPPIKALSMNFDEEMFKQYENPEKFVGSELTIVEYPNPILRASNEDVRDFDGALVQTCKEMFEIMYAAKGVGLAAPQVGINRRLFVYNINPTVAAPLRRFGEVIVVNPKIVEYCKPTDIEIEGCLSSRSECCCGDIRRASEIFVEYQDVKGRMNKMKLWGFEARVFQHEYDHIEGVLHIDRQSPSDRRKIQPFLDALIEQHGPGGAVDLAPEKASQLQPPPLWAQDAKPSSTGDAGSIGNKEKESGTPPRGFGSSKSKSKKR